MNIQSAWQKTHEKFDPFFPQGVLPDIIEYYDISFAYEASAESEPSRISTKLIIRPNDRKLSVQSIEVSGGARKNSMGLLCYALLVDFARNMQYPQLAMYCMNMGSYVWLLCGAKPNFTIDDRIVTSREIQARLLDIKSIINDDLYQKMMELSECNRIEDLVNIATDRTNIFEMGGVDLSSIRQSIVTRIQGHAGYENHNVPLGFYLTVNLGFDAVHNVMKDQVLLRERLKVKRPDVLGRLTL